MADDNDVANLTLRILRDIRDEARETNQRIDETNRQLVAFKGAVQSELGSIRLELSGLRGEIGLVNDRLEGIRDLAGERWRDHEERIQRLEATTGID